MSAIINAAEHGGNTEAPPDDWDADSSDGSEVVNGKAANEDDDDNDDDDDADETNEESDSVDTSDDDDDNIDDHILQRYQRLSSRRVDLVGDYAGDELFVIEGDSMLLQSFSDSKLDFSPGLQMLHAAYNVEHFLHNLVKRKCNFDIVFFDTNKDLCIPTKAKPEDAVKYLLARAAIIRHLEINLPRVRQDIAVKTFFPELCVEPIRAVPQGDRPVLRHDARRCADCCTSRQAHETDSGGRPPRQRKGGPSTNDPTIHSARLQCCPRQRAGVARHQGHDDGA